MLGAYAGYTLLSLGVDFWFTLVLAPLIVAALAGILEKFLIRHLYKEPDIYILL